MADQKSSWVSRFLAWTGIGAKKRGRELRLRREAGERLVAEQGKSLAAAKARQRTTEAFWATRPPGRN